MRLIKLVFLWIVLSGTVLGQSTTPDSVYYTTQQDLNCLKCLMQSTLKDSLINEYKVQVRSADTIINNLQFANHELKEVIEEDRKELIKRRLNVYKF